MRLSPAIHTIRVRPVTAILLLALSAGVGAGPTLPEQFALTFAVMREDTRLGETRWSLSRNGDNHYRFETITRATGFVSLVMGGKRREMSTWEYHEQRMRPLAYRYERSGARGRQVEIVFDWAQGIAHNTAQGSTWKLKLEPGTLDKLLYMLALMKDLGSGRQELSYRIADGGRLKTYVAEIVGREALDTILGPVETVKVRPRLLRDDRETILWCAPSLHYIPVQMAHREQDKVTTLKLESLEGFGSGS